MAIQSRADALAVKKESTEGTPVFPTAGTDFIAPQDDLTMTPGFEVLENAERKNSLGKAKSILGRETPSASTSHYLRHSGVEGTAPGYSEFLEASLGQENTATGGERDTVGGSTTTAIEVDTGEGTEFPLGRPMLIKDGTNGYSIRFSDGATGDTISPSFALDNAPASGVLTGDPVWYSPTTTGHPTLTMTQYVGNTAAGSIQQIAGARVTDMSIQADAGQLINASYSLEGILFNFSPIEVTATDTFLDFTDDGGTFAAQITAKTYKDPYELASAIQTAMNSVQTAETHAVTYDDATGKFTVSTSTSAVLSLLWNTGTNAANTVGDVLGFSTAADDTGSTSYLADNAQDFSAPASPSFDSAVPLAAKDNEVLLGDQDDNVCFEASTLNVTVSTPKRDIESVCATSGTSGSVVQEREVTISLTALLEDYQADEWRRFRENETTKFQFSFGTKSGGNWEAGKSGGVYCPTATITSFAVEDDDGLASLSLELTSFVNDDGDGEVFIGFV